MTKRDFLIVYDTESLDLVELTENDFRIGFFGHGNDLGYGTGLGGREPGINKTSNQPGNLPKLSRDHCKITLEDGVRYVYDLGSRTGTYLNGNRISESREEGKAELKENDIVSFIPHKDNFLLNVKYVRR